MDFFDLVKKRRSVRKFSNENVPDEVILKALKTALLAANSSNLQPWEFYWVKDDIKKEDLYQTFNMGIGLVLIIDKSQKQRLVSLVGKDNCSEIGFIIKDGLNSVHLSEQ